METLQTWWATELYPMRERDQFGVSGEFEVVLAADAQVTIAALRGQLEQVQEERSKYIQAVGLATTCAADMQIDTSHPSEMMQEVCKRFTQRTAELETIRRVLDEKADCADLWYDEFLRIRALNASQEINGICDRALDGITRNVPVVKENHELHSELERVRDQYADLRKMVLALPKVEGEITVEQRGDEFVVMVGTLIWLKCYKTDEILINAIVALWQHRQGMEG